MRECERFSEEPHHQSSAGIAGSSTNILVDGVGQLDPVKGLERTLKAVKAFEVNLIHVEAIPIGVVVGKLH